VFIDRLKHIKAISDGCDALTIHSYMLIEARNRFRANRGKSSTSAASGIAEGSFAISINIAQYLLLLVNHGILSFYTKLTEYMNEKGSDSSKSRKEFLGSPGVVGVMAKMSVMVASKDFISHPKMTKLVECVVEHFREYGQQETRVMVFSQYRNSVEEIHSQLQKLEGIKPAMFIGQSTTNKSKGISQKDQKMVLLNTLT